MTQDADPLRWDDLRCFLAVARGGTLTAAAEQLGVNASTVHRRLAALEEALGARLFDRDPRGYALTGVGEALVPRAAEVAEGVAALRRAATGHDRRAAGPVRVSLPPSLVPLVAPMLAEVAAACPNLEPQLLASPALVDLRRDAEVALRIGAPPDDAIAWRIGPVPWGVFAPRDAADPSGLPWIGYVDMDHVAAVRWRDRAHAGERVGWRVDEVAAARDLSRALAARALLPIYVGWDEPGLALVERVPEGTGDLCVLAHTDLRRSARVRALLDHLLPALRAAAPLLDGFGSG